ncbi:MAG TPA: winged helix-turn-helix domain-containing protein [Lacipirellulaceae bacterium]|nr:winged helix-turn-helix domain-containing protein [Lacipirellulaceae bacterium]
MAKKKPAKSTKVAKPRVIASKPAKTVDTARERLLETEATTPPADAPPTAKRIKASKSAPVVKREVGALTGIEIGHVAGDVWGALSRKGPATLVTIKKEVKAPADVVAAAIGWLAREEKLDFDTTGRTVKISLR